MEFKNQRDVLKKNACDLLCLALRRGISSGGAKPQRYALSSFSSRCIMACPDTLKLFNT